MEILVVEDEQSIRVLLERVLARSGHAVTAYADPAEALADTSSYKLAIVDYTLPGMDGLMLIEQLRRRQQNLAIILCSGIPITPPLCHPPIQFLQKPYRASQLGELVNSAIAALPA